MSLAGASEQLWAGFGAVVLAAIALDLGVLHRKAHRIGMRAALVESAGWIGLAVAFNGWVYVSLGHRAGLEYFTGYIVEKSLSIDNIFLFLLIFQGLRVPAHLQHKVLYYGVAGAVVMRGIFVFGGVALLDHFHWVLYLFGAILLLTAGRMLFTAEPEIDVEHHWLLSAVRRFIRVTPEYEGGNFFLRRGGKWNATPLLVALVAVEAADIVFAVDSVPAVLAVTRNVFIAFSSNVFAILGLRALYFALADLLPRFRFLRPGLAAILLFAGIKILANDRLPMSVGLSLGVIVAIVAVMIAASLLWPGKKGQE